MEDSAATLILNTREAPNQEVARRSVLKRYFLLSLLVSTWVPFLFFILVAPSHPGSGSLSAVKTVFLFLGTAHVPATLFFYTDRAFSPIIRKHKFRYVYAPILLAVTTGLLFAFLSTTGQAFLLLAYWAWQAFHYGRQNIGIYAFASIAQTGTAPHRMEKLAIDFGTILGILGTFKILGTAVAPAYLHRTFGNLYQFGHIAFAAVLLFSLIVYVKLYRNTTLFKTLFFFTSVFFFYPVFISTDMNIGFLSYAMAHGLQYIIFMTVISVNDPPETGRGTVQFKNIMWLLVFVLVIGFVFYRGGELRTLEAIRNNTVYLKLADFLFGALLGATMGHFVIDAGAWKLSSVLQRTYITKRFGFIFNKESAGT
ncbi:MAG TPA: hypothetical protein VGJ55_01870 [Pyrinomonadaceae bacterium]|jgi:hypothetical protein